MPSDARFGVDVDVGRNDGVVHGGFGDGGAVAGGVGAV